MASSVSGARASAAVCDWPTKQGWPSKLEQVKVSLFYQESEVRMERSGDPRP